MLKTVFSLSANFFISSIDNNTYLSGATVATIVSAITVANMLNKRTKTTDPITIFFFFDFILLPHLSR